MAIENDGCRGRYRSFHCYNPRDALLVTQSYSIPNVANIFRPRHGCCMKAYPMVINKIRANIAAQRLTTLRYTNQPFSYYSGGIQVGTGLANFLFRLASVNTNSVVQRHHFVGSPDASSPHILPRNRPACGEEKKISMGADGTGFRIRSQCITGQYI